MGRKAKRMNSKLNQIIERLDGIDHLIDVLARQQPEPEEHEPEPPRERLKYTYGVALNPDAPGYAGGQEGTASYIFEHDSEILETVWASGTDFEFNSITIAGEEQIPRGLCWPMDCFVINGARARQFAGTEVKKGDALVVKFRNLSEDKDPVGMLLAVKVRSELRG